MGEHMGLVGIENGTGRGLEGLQHSRHLGGDLQLVLALLNEGERKCSATALWSAVQRGVERCEEWEWLGVGLYSERGLG
jgi:hypothetical protein